MLVGAYDELGGELRVGDALYRHAHYFRIIHYSRRHYNDNDRNNDRVEIGRDARDAGPTHGVRAYAHVGASRRPTAWKIANK